MKDKQRRFCEEFVIDLNGAQAAIRAGYSENSARQIAHQLLATPEVQALTKTLGEEVSHARLVTAERVSSKLRDIAFDDNQKTSDQLKALEVLGKHLRMFDPESKKAGSGFQMILTLPHNGRDEPSPGAILAREPELVGDAAT